MSSMKFRFGFKKHAIDGVISERYCTFVQTNQDSYARMRLLLIFLSSLLSAFLRPSLGLSQNASGSNIVSRTMLSSDCTASVNQRVYDNGLGDIVQEIQSYTGSSLPSVTVHHEYDEYRRRTKSWLPVSSSDSLFIAGNMIAYNAVSQYSDNAPYSRTVYDGFLPSQPSAQYKAGVQWQNNGKKVSLSYSEYVGAGMFSPEDGYLYMFENVKYLRTQTTDEDGGVTSEYTDLNGRLMISETIQGKTYYLYNTKGDITYVMPPALSSYLISQYGTEVDEIPDTEAMIQKYAYIYRYDRQRHCIYKKLPGCDPVYYIYDRAGQCILTQDGILRQSGKWAYTIPDKFGRPCISGICQYSGSYTAEPLHSVHVYAEYDGSSTATGGYTVHNLTLTGQTLYSAAYYDGYSFIGQHGVPSTLTASTVSGFTFDASVHHGMQTGSATAVLSNGSVTGYTYAALYYDSRYNVSQVKATDHLGGTGITSTSYTYTGKPLRVNIQRSKGSSGTTYINRIYTYDGADRMGSCIFSIAHGTPSLSSTQTYAYDALGRLSSVTRPFTSGTVSYSYDLHGWTTGITTNSFYEELFYASGPGNPRWNGNISAMRWHNDGYYYKRGYKFMYDGANRLTQATYGEGDALALNTGRFSEGVQYGANGKIVGITRKGKSSSNSYGLMDNLTLSYDGNRLTGVSETASDYDFTGSFEYKKANGSQYIYNSNGSLVADRSRNIAYITYDANNNPQTIYFTNGNEIRYTYSGTGEKLCAKYYNAVPNVTRAFGVKPEGYPQSQIMCVYQYDYILGGSMVMYNGMIDKVLFDGGYAKGTPFSSTGYGFTLYYYNKDHLGNNREVVNASGNVQQLTNYYPFGAPYTDPKAVVNASLQPYKYNGKELDLMHGLNTYDYGARQYYPILCRWDRVDPLCEKNPEISPYAYCANNPTNAIDPDGRSVWTKGAKLLWKVGKQVAKKGPSALKEASTYTSAFTDIKEDFNTMTDGNASTWDRAVAGVSLISEIVSPISLKEGKAIYNNAKSLVHGNSKMSTKAQHAYDIINTKTNKVVKTGVSGGPIKDEKSVRAETQVKKWNKQEGDGTYKSEITHYEPEGEGARSRILDYEKERADKYRDQLDPQKHKRP